MDVEINAATLAVLNAEVIHLLCSECLPRRTLRQGNSLLFTEMPTFSSVAVCRERALAVTRGLCSTHSWRLGRAVRVPCLLLNALSRAGLADVRGIEPTAAFIPRRPSRRRLTKSGPVKLSSLMLNHCLFYLLIRRVLNQLQHGLARHHADSCAACLPHAALKHQRGNRVPAEPLCLLTSPPQVCGYSQIGRGPRGPSAPARFSALGQRNTVSGGRYRRGQPSHPHRDRPARTARPLLPVPPQGPNSPNRSHQLAPQHTGSCSPGEESLRRTAASANCSTQNALRRPRSTSIGRETDYLRGVEEGVGQ